MMGGTRRPRLLSRALVLVGALVLALGLCEAIVRLLHLEEPRFIQRDPIYGISHIPGQAGYWKKGPKPSYIEINSKGFRGPERSYEKPPGTYRIVLIGDSYVEAFSIPYEETLSHLLEERFRAEGYPVEVVGLGMSDFGTAQELLLLEREGFRYDPDLVLLAFAHNDPANNHPRLYGNTDRPYFRLDPDGRLERLPYHPQNNSRGMVRDFLRRNLRIYTFFPSRVREAFRKVRRRSGGSGGGHAFESYQFYPTASHPPGREAWELTFAILKEFRRVSEARGASFVLLDIPYRGQVVRRYWEQFLTDYPEIQKAGESFERQQPQELLSEFCRREAMQCLSLLALFREAAARGVNPYGDKDFHWNAEGNRLAAEALVELLMPLVASPFKS